MQAYVRLRRDGCERRRLADDFDAGLVVGRSEDHRAVESGVVRGRSLNDEGDVRGELRDGLYLHAKLGQAYVQTRSYGIH